MPEDQYKYDASFLAVIKIRRAGVGERKMDVLEHRENCFIESIFYN